MSSQTWLVSLSIMLLLGSGVIGTVAWKQKHQLQNAQEELAQLRTSTEQHQVDVQDLEAELQAGKAALEALQREKEQESDSRKRLEEEMRSALQSKDITISELQGKLTVNILDRIMFDSGSAELKPEGQKVLRQIAGVLAQYPKRQILVVGHTDNVPVKASAKRGFTTNWELSAARATAAVRFLCEKAGVDPRRLGALGYGEYHPVADNSTDGGKAKNRRIALVILAEELLTVDTAPQGAPSVPTTTRPGNAPKATPPTKAGEAAPEPVTGDAPGA